MKSKLSRRDALKLLAGGVAGASVAGWPVLRDRRDAWAQAGRKPYFSIVLACTGGGSIIDTFMPIRESESANGSTINAYPDAEVIENGNSPIKSVTLSNATLNSQGFRPPVQIGLYESNPNFLTEFTNAHRNEMLVATYTGSSVNHAIAQKRSLTGNAAWRGRTLQEAVAAEYGEGFPIPNINMGFMGYLEPGTDNALPPGANQEPVALPYTFPLSMHGSRGIVGSPSTSLIDRARALRDNRLSTHSDFQQKIQSSPKIQRWLEQREKGKEIEGMDLITNLQFIPDLPPNIILSDYGLQQSPDGALVNAAFPNWLDDPFEAQGALAFLLIKHQVSCAVTLSPNWDLGITPNEFTQPFYAFDGSHGDHRYTQATMWNRMLNAADRLIRLLKMEVFDPDTGETFWDRSMIYFASEFGRTKDRPADTLDFGTSHDLNNGCMVVSPLVNGNTVLGGVDPDTALTYGWDPVTGNPMPNTTNSEADVFAGLLQSLEIDTSGSSLPDVPAFVGS